MSQNYIIQPSYKIKQIKPICRICMGFTPNMYDIFAKCSTTKISVADTIRQIAPVSVEEIEDLPKTICENCLKKIQAVHELRLMIIASDNVLRKDYQKLKDEVSSLEMQELSGEQVFIFDNNQMIKFPQNQEQNQNSSVDLQNINTIQVLDQNGQILIYQLDNENKLSQQNAQVSEIPILTLNQSQSNNKEQTTNVITDQEQLTNFLNGQQLQSGQKIFLTDNNQIINSSGNIIMPDNISINNSNSGQKIFLTDMASSNNNNTQNILIADNNSLINNKCVQNVIINSNKTSLNNSGDVQFFVLNDDDEIVSKIINRQIKENVAKKNINSKNIKARQPSSSSNCISFTESFSKTNETKNDDDLDILIESVETETKKNTTPSEKGQSEWEKAFLESLEVKKKQEPFAKTKKQSLPGTYKKYTTGGGGGTVTIGNQQIKNTNLIQQTQTSSIATTTNQISVIQSKPDFMMNKNYVAKKFKTGNEKTELNPNETIILDDDDED